MLVNPDVDSYAETLNHHKMIRKTQKITTYWKPKEYYNRNITWCGSLVFTFRLPGGHFAPLPPVSYVTGYDMLFLHAVSCPYSTATRYEMVA